MVKTFIYPKFPVVKNSLHVEMKKRVQAYFEENNIKQQGNRKIITKAIILLATFATLYIFLLFGNYPWYVGILGAAILGFVIALIGFNVMHDGAHGCFSSNALMNKIAGHSLSFLGASQFMWNMKHNIIHHTFTNVDGVDDDIEAGILLRLAPQQRYYKIHKVQHIYFWLLYTQMYIYWIFFTDYKKYFRNRIGQVPLKKMPKSEHFIFWFLKVHHLFLYVVLPILVLGWAKWLIGFLVMSLVGGFFLSIVFQLAHTVMGNDFPSMAEGNKLPMEFAEHQLETTANFATKNKVWTWLLGGLNYQVEHHLFPKVSHVHYPAISKIIKQVCEERNVPYHEAKNMRTAIKNHILFLKAMGRPPKFAA